MNFSSEVSFYKLFISCVNTMKRDQAGLQLFAFQGNEDDRFEYFMRISECMIMLIIFFSGTDILLIGCPLVLRFH